MRRVLLALAGGLLICGAAPAATRTTAETVEQAFMIGCNLHVIGASLIDEKSAGELEKSGIVVTSEGANADVLRPGPPGSGRRVVTRVNTPGGPVFMIGYPESGFCSMQGRVIDADLAFEAVRGAIEAEGSFWRLDRDLSNEKGGLLAREYKFSLTSGIKGGLMVRATTAAAGPDAKVFVLIAYRDSAPTRPLDIPAPRP